MNGIIRKHGSQSIIVNDPQSPTDLDRVPLHVRSIDTGSQNRQSGFLPPQDLAKLIEHAGAILPETDVRVHGSSFGACPTGTTLQLAAALLYGTYFPDESNPDVAVIIHAIGATRTLLNRTRIRMGTLLDAAGMYEWLRAHPKFAGIFRICDDQTKVIPDEVPALMQGMDLRR
jgi:hypothetical protein